MNDIPIKRVTRIQTLCDIFNYHPSLKMLFTKVDKLLKIYLTIPGDNIYNQTQLLSLATNKNLPEEFNDPGPLKPLYAPSCFKK